MIRPLCSSSDGSSLQLANRKLCPFLYQSGRRTPPLHLESQRRMSGYASGNPPYFARRNRQGCHHPTATEGTLLSSATQLRTRIMAVGGVIVCLLVAGVWILATQSSAQSAQTTKAATTRHHATEVAAGPLQVSSVTPAAHSTGVSGVAPIKIQFSEPVAAGSPLPSVHPA